MRVTVSLPASLIEQADRAADRLQMSRSRLFRRALQSYLRRLEEDELTARMDAFVDKRVQRLSGSPDRYPMAAWAREMGNDEW